MLFFIVVVTQTQLWQLLKIPVLVAHFQEHKKENKNISIARFLQLHYANGNKRDKDYDRDMQLPYKTVDINTFCFEFIPIQPFVPIPLKVYNFPKPVFGIKEVNYAHQIGNNIWQPPRFA